MKPSVGRIVHYQTYGTPGGEYLSEPMAAIVTKVYPGGSLVDLSVFYDSGLSFRRGVKYAAGRPPVPGCWSWPPRE